QPLHVSLRDDIDLIFKQVNQILGAKKQASLFDLLIPKSHAVVAHAALIASLVGSVTVIAAKLVNKFSSDCASAADEFKTLLKETKYQLVKIEKCTNEESRATYRDSQGTVTTFEFNPKSKTFKETRLVDNEEKSTVYVTDQQGSDQQGGKFVLIRAIENP